MQMRLNSLCATLTLAFCDNITLHDADTYGEQQRDPHPCLTPDSVIVSTSNNAERNAAPLSDLLETLAPFFGYTVAGSYIAAIILHPHEQAS